MSVVLSEHLPLLAAAPDGIQKLRGLILELAMRGKLVPQDPADEPASELLKRIAQERALMETEGGTCKKMRSLPPVEEGETRFQAPDSWKWCRFEELFSLEYGDNLPAPKRTGTGEYPVYGSNGVVGTHNECRVKAPCIVVGRKGSAGALNLCQEQGCWVTDVAYYCVPPTGIDLDFAFRLFHTLRLDELGKGIKPGLSRSEAYSITVAIPPLAEQHRIVGKVDELMALCDRLETEQADADTAHAKLVDTLLGMLTRSIDAADLAANWQRLADHFDTLFTTQSSLDALKQTILQLAVMGKLVPQDPKEEPASALLNRIRDDGKGDFSTSNSGQLEHVPDEGLAFAPPPGWAWTQGETVANFIDPHPSHRTPPEFDGGVPYIGYAEIDHNRGINFIAARKVSHKVFEEHQSRYCLRKGDFVFGKIGTLGKPFFLPEPFDYCLSANLILIQPNSSIMNPRFLAIFLDSPSFIRVMGDRKTNSTHGVFGIKKARSIYLPLPPLAEQHRIVAKVDELMALCDRLKADLAESRRRQERLASTLIESALEAPHGRPNRVVETFRTTQILVEA